MNICGQIFFFFKFARGHKTILSQKTTREVDLKLNYFMFKNCQVPSEVSMSSKVCFTPLGGVEISVPVPHFKCKVDMSNHFLFVQV